MTMNRPRTFCWVSRNGVPFPQIIFDDPRVGCEYTVPMPGTEIKLELDDKRTIDELAAAHPAPVEAA